MCDVVCPQTRVCCAGSADALCSKALFVPNHNMCVSLPRDTGRCCAVMDSRLPLGAGHTTEECCRPERPSNRMLTTAAQHRGTKANQLRILHMHVTQHALGQSGRMCYMPSRP